MRMPFAIGGSGSTYIYGHCDNTYKVRFNAMIRFEYCFYELDERKTL